MEKTRHFHPRSRSSVDSASAQRGHRCHREGQLLHVGGDAVEGVPEPELVDAGDDLGADQQQDGDEPVAVEEAAFDQRLGAERGGDPGGD
jgi:hypothetical protein